MRKIFFFLGSIVILFSSLNAQVLINNIQLRAAENRIYNILESIKVANFYINTYILNFAINPTQGDLIAQYGAQSNLTAVTWPRAFDNNASNVTFNIDTVTFQVTFNNIFVNIPNNNIRQIYTNHPSLPQGSIVNNDLSLTIPMDSLTMQFQNEVNIINAMLDIPPTGGSPFYPEPIISRVETTCTAVGGANVTWYQPDGGGGFRLRFCNGFTAVDMPAVINFRYTNDGMIPSTQVGQMGEKSHVLNTATGFVEPFVFDTLNTSTRLVK